jgi:hypothetical protein
MGRPKGAKNKISKDIKTMILKALDKAGGEDYLLKQALADNPAPFLTLVGKVLPLQLTGEGGGAIIIQATSHDEAL